MTLVDDVLYWISGMRYEVILGNLISPMDKEVLTTVFQLQLEKEALVKGVPIRQAIDIEIPPPRPKRKPSNPYPRKTGVAIPSLQVGAKDGNNSSSVSSSCTATGKQILDLEREPLPEKPDGDEKQENVKENQDEGNFSEVLTLFQEAPCTSLSSVDKDSIRTLAAPRNSCTFREFVPMMVSTQDETNESYVTVEPRGIQKLVKFDAKQTVQDNGTNYTSNLESSIPSHEKLVQGKKTDEMCHPENFGALPSSDMQATHNYPRHVPVHVLNGSLGMNTENVSSDMSCQESIFHQIGGIHGCPNPFSLFDKLGIPFEGATF
ncbi:protein LHY-like [Camellia sinensis]|uniref:protein LHY-like n=1 Tax=Camellia sinensis TaxID=4442 RepID=UPI0010366DD8|nr:protein LHY-like [Camellia sinensis]